MFVLSFLKKNNKRKSNFERVHLKIEKKYDNAISRVTNIQLNVFSIFLSFR